MEDEYEIVPTSPLRRLEKRLTKIENTTSSSELHKLTEQIIELIKANQRVIDDIIKSDAELRSEVSKIPGKIDSLLSTMNQFVEMLKAAATAESMPEEITNKLVKKMEQLVDETKGASETNRAMLTSLGTIENRLKRLYMNQYGSDQTQQRQIVRR